MSNITEDFILGDSVSDIPRRLRKEKDLESDLFKNTGQGVDYINNQLDAFEQQVGIKNKSPKSPNIQWKNILLSPGADVEDSVLLNTLLNDSELYSIRAVDKSWTAKGEIKFFVIFGENLDIKEEREKKKGS